MIRDNNFITIQGFMINKLGLKGNKLLIYAIIYGFSQNGNDKFTGCLKYLVEWTNSTKQSVIKNLKSLVDSGLIIKNDKYINNIKFCEYSANLSAIESLPLDNKIDKGGKESLPRGGKKSLPNNIYIDNIYKEDIDKSISKKEEAGSVSPYADNDSKEEPSEKTQSIDFQKIKDLWNKNSHYGHIRTIDKKRQKKIKALLNDTKTTYEEFILVIKLAAHLPSFYQGDNDRKWTASFDWLIANTNGCYVQILEGSRFNTPESRKAYEKLTNGDSILEEDDSIVEYTDNNRPDKFEDDEGRIWSKQLKRWLN